MDYEEADNYATNEAYRVKVKQENKSKKSPKPPVYDPEWETRPEFSWLSRCSYDPDYAYCILCKSKIQAQISTLKSHANSKKHKQRIMGCIGTGKEGVMLQILYDNEATVEETDAPAEEEENYANSDIKDLKPKKFRPSGLVYNTKRKVAERTDWQPSAARSDWQSPSPGSIIEKVERVGGGAGRMGFQSGNRGGSGGGGSNTTADDEFAVFGRYIGNELRQVTDSFAQQTAKMKINTILFEALTGQYNRQAQAQQQQPEVSQPYQIVVCPTGTNNV